MVQKCFPPSTSPARYDKAATRQTNIEQKHLWDVFYGFYQTNYKNGPKTVPQNNKAFNLFSKDIIN